MVLLVRTLMAASALATTDWTCGPMKQDRALTINNNATSWISQFYFDGELTDISEVAWQSELIATVTLPPTAKPGDTIPGGLVPARGDVSIETSDARFLAIDGDLQTKSGPSPLQVRLTPRNMLNDFEPTEVTITARDSEGAIIARLVARVGRIFPRIRVTAGAKEESVSTPLQPKGTFHNKATLGRVSKECGREAVASIIGGPFVVPNNLRDGVERWALAMVEIGYEMSVDTVPILPGACRVETIVDTEEKLDWQVRVRVIHQGMRIKAEWERSVLTNLPGPSVPTDSPHTVSDEDGPAVARGPRAVVQIPPETLQHFESMLERQVRYHYSHKHRLQVRYVPEGPPPPGGAASSARADVKVKTKGICVIFSRLSPHE